MTRPTQRMLDWQWQEKIGLKDRKTLDGHQSVYFNRLMDLAQPVEENDAATKKYTDDLFNQLLGGILDMFKFDINGNLLINANALPLPTGASEAAKQDIGNASLASINAKTSLVYILSGANVGVDGNIYASGDLMGGKLTLSNVIRVAGGSGILQEIAIHDLTNQKAALDVILFNSNPSTTTFTNNAALDVSDADLVRIIGHVSILASDYISFADNAVATKSGLAMPVDVAAGRDLYACVVSRGTPTYTANELGIVFGFLQD